jgi:hypothetical protein
MHLLKRTFITLAALTPFFFASAAHAANGADFQAGRIIDDQVFFDANALSVQQIQSFLFTKIQTCDSSGNQIFTGYYDGRDSQGVNHSPLPSPHSYTSGDNIKRAQLDNRYPAPYTCLKDYIENTSTHANNIGTPTTPVSGGISAAQIIYNEAQNYSISPKVLLVLIQKESSLVTDDWPWPNEYKTATGYGCPDTAACDSTYFGFYNQVHNAARQYRLYANNPNNYNFVIGANSILEHPVDQYCPNPARISVNIVNQATAGLYNYTPYTPNAAALSNLYGTGNSCSAYGNRNFWRLYVDWFGDTLTSGYSFVSAINPPATIQPEQISNVSITVKNTSTSIWYADGNVPSGGHATRLMTLGYENTPYANTGDAAWLGTRNQIKMFTASVAPGANATFSFSFKGPIQTSSFDHKFTVVIDGVLIYKYIGMEFNVATPAPTYDYNFVSATNPTSTILPNEVQNVAVVVKNTGNTTWYSDGNTPSGYHPIRLGMLAYKNSPYSTMDTNWLGTQNQVRMVETKASPGENATFNFSLSGPFAITSYSNAFTLVADGVGFFADKGLQFNISTPKPIYSYSFVSAVNPPATMTTGQLFAASIQLNNTGNVVWRNEASKLKGIGSTRIIMTQPTYRNSLFSSADPLWLGTSSQLSMTTSTVNPGSSATFNMPWTAPSKLGSYREPFTIGIDGISVMADIGMQFTTAVQ